MAIMDALGNSELFRGLETAELRKLSELCRGRSYPQGVAIFNEGDEATELYILTNGRVVLEMEVRPVPDRPPIPTALEVITEGECFGWSSLVEPHIYTLSARCMSNCTVLAIKADRLRAAMAADPAMGYQVITRLAQLISLRLAHTRLRLVSGLGLALLSTEMKRPE